MSGGKFFWRGSVVSDFEVNRDEVLISCLTFWPVFWLLNLCNCLCPAEPAEMSGPEVAKTPGGGAPGKEGKEPVANGHAGEGNDANPFAEYMWMENEEEYNRQVWCSVHIHTQFSFYSHPFYSVSALLCLCKHLTHIPPLIFFLVGFDFHIIIIVVFRPASAPCQNVFS